jgi:hypothetical protein
MPPIYVGGTEISDLKVGGTDVQEVYVGTQKIWDRVPTFESFSVEGSLGQFNATHMKNWNLAGNGTNFQLLNSELQWRNVNSFTPIFGYVLEVGRTYNWTTNVRNLNAAGGYISARIFGNNGAGGPDFGQLLAEGTRANGATVTESSTSLAGDGQLRFFGFGVEILNNDQYRKASSYFRATVT